MMRMVRWVHTHRQAMALALVSGMLLWALLRYTIGGQTLHVLGYCGGVIAVLLIVAMVLAESVLARRR